MPSCERLWDDVAAAPIASRSTSSCSSATRREHDIYPGIVREHLAARGLAEPSRRSRRRLPTRRALTAGAPALVDDP